MIEIDGSFGEGGGQILRTALGLSLVTRKSFRLRNIRAGRKNPGLQNQHLACVHAARTIGNAECSGDSLGSRDLVFHPGETVPGSYSFDVGSAGSATLVIQTVLPPLLAAGAKSAISVTGGTHNTFAPPFDFFTAAFSALLARIGIRIDSSIERYGFYPAGGGRITASISRQGGKDPFMLMERGKLVNARVRAIVSNLPAEIAAAEAQLIIEELDAEEIASSVEKASSNGPGNVVMIELNYENVTEVFTGFGEKGKHRDEVAREAIDEANEYIGSGVPVGRHLADQLLIPIALSGGGSFVTLPPTLHTKTNSQVIGMFTDAAIRFERIDEKKYKVIVDA